MSSVHTQIPDLDRKGLREFGLLMAAVIVVLFGAVLPWLFDAGWPRWPWILAVLFVLPALLSPELLRPVYRGWMRVGLFLNRIMTPLILSIVFYLVFTPMAIILKLLGKDAMRRDLDPTAETYRIDNRDTKLGDMERPF